MIGTLFIVTIVLALVIAVFLDFVEKYKGEE